MVILSVAGHGMQSRCMVYDSGKLGGHRSIYRIIPLDDASKWLLYSGFLGVPGNNGFSKGMFIYMYIYISIQTVFLISFVSVQSFLGNLQMVVELLF